MRIIPILQLFQGRLVKTCAFQRPSYLGDPINATRIFSEKEVDELTIIDIGATTCGYGVNLGHLAQIVATAFMPISYGGGVRSISEMRQIYRVGVEKIIIGAAAAERPEFVREAVTEFGSSSVVVSVDVRNGDTRPVAAYRSASRILKIPLAEYLQLLDDFGTGEILLNDVDRDSSMTGYNLELVASAVAEVGCPVVCNGGAGTPKDLVAAHVLAGASGAAGGSMFVYAGRLRGILISYPCRSALAAYNAI